MGGKNRIESGGHGESWEGDLGGIMKKKKKIQFPACLGRKGGETAIYHRKDEQMKEKDREKGRIFFREGKRPGEGKKSFIECCKKKKGERKLN